DETTLRLEEIIRVEVNASVERIDRSKTTARCRCAARASRELRASCSVLLDAIRIDAEKKRDLSRVVGVEKNLDLIFAVDIVPIRVRRAHDVAVDLARTNSEIDRVG